MKPIRVVQFGVGPIGTELVKYAFNKEGVSIVGAIDIDPNKVGKDLGELTIGSRIGITISGDAEELLTKTQPDIVLHSTSSHLKDVKPQLLTIMEAGADIVSTCEELSYPFLKNPEISEELQKEALRNNVTILGTGVNPGFVMDTLVLTATGVCQDVKSVKSSRIQNASYRRLPFQKKIGAGLTTAEFRAKVADGTMGHVGFPESIAMIAAGLGWTVDRIEERIEPKLAGSPVESEYLRVETGHVAGLNQTAVGIIGGQPAIQLNLEAYLGCPNPEEHIIIDGRPSIDLTINGGIHGDIATAAVVVNCMPRVLNAQPGLLTMKDLPVPSGWFSGIGRFLSK